MTSELSSLGSALDLAMTASASPQEGRRKGVRGNSAASRQSGALGVAQRWRPGPYAANLPLRHHVVRVLPAAVAPEADPAPLARRPMQIHDAERSRHAVAAPARRLRTDTMGAGSSGWGRKGAGSGSKEPDGGSGLAHARHGASQKRIDGAQAASIWRARGAPDALPPAGRKGSMPAAARALRLVSVPGRWRPYALSGTETRTVGLG